MENFNVYRTEYIQKMTDKMQIIVSDRAILTLKYHFLEKAYLDKEEFNLSFGRYCAVVMQKSGQAETMGPWAVLQCRLGSPGRWRAFRTRSG